MTDSNDPLVVACKKCDRPTRRPKVPAAEHPGTASWGGAGMCSRCYRPAKGQSLSDLVAEQRQEANRCGLDDFLQARRQRLNRKEHHGLPTQQTPPGVLPPQRGRNHHAAKTARRHYESRHGPRQGVYVVR